VNARRLALAALVALLAAVAAPGLAAQRAGAEPEAYGELGQPSPEEGLAALARFRTSVIRDAFHLEFELRFMPRRGATVTTPCRLWSGPTPRGQGTLVEVGAPGSGVRFLVLNGEGPEVWAVEPGAPAPRMLSGAEVFRPLAGTQFTPFLIQMPFIFWQPAYEGLQRLRSRPTHAFLMSPPLGFPTAAAGFERVRILLDSQFSALNEVEFLDAAGARAFRFSAGEITKVDERWMLRWADYRDERTRDKTRLLVRGAAVALEFPDSLFEPATLTGRLPQVPADRIRTLGR
jgi:hypothetical protein